MVSSRKKKSKSKSTNKNKTTQKSLKQLLKDFKNNPNDIETGLDLADNYIRNNQADNIFEVLSAFENDYPYENRNINNKYNFSIAYAYTFTNQFEKAEKIIKRWGDDSGDLLESSYLQCYIYLSLKEYDNAEKAGLRYFELYKNKSSNSINDLIISKQRLAQVYNFMGSIKVGQTELDDAIIYFEKSIKTDKKTHLPYLNLANLYSNTNNKDKAQKIVNKGIINCLEVQELRIMANSLDAKPTISACMIVKNEEELLPECLESIRDWVDEIVIVDTGSTDKTIEIAKSYGAKIYHQKWESNFSKHRNYSIDEATSDWIFIIDADERFYNEDVEIIKKQINKSDYSIIAINVYNVSGKFEEKVTSLASVRFFKNELNLHYKGRVHNQLEIDPSIPIIRTKARLKHLGYGLSEDKMAAKAKRTIELLEKQIKDRPDFAFAYFNYAQVLMGQDLSVHLDNPPKIIKAASKAVELTNPDKPGRGEKDIHLMCLEQLALIYFITGQNDKAEEKALRALEIKDDYLDPILLLGNIYLRNKEFIKAEEYYNRYLTVQKKYDQSVGVDELMVLHPQSFHHAYYGLGMVCEFKKDWDQAIKYYNDVLKTHWEFLDTCSRLGKIYLSNGDNEKADELFRKQFKIDPKSHLSAVGLACTNFIFDNNEEANKWAEKALELVPSDCPDLAEYARVINAANQRELAVKFLEKATTGRINNINVIKNLAKQCFDLGEYDHSAHFYKLLVESSDSNPEWLNDLGGCYYKLENYEEAEKYYQKALEQEDFPAISYRNIGLARLKLGKIQETVIVLEKYIELEPDQYEIVALLGDLYKNLNDFSRAISYYERYLKIYSTETLVLFSLSECYLIMGHRDSAILGFNRILQIDPDFKPAQQKLFELQQLIEN